MIGRTNVALRRRVLVVDHGLFRPETAGGRAIRGIVDELRARDLDVIESAALEDGIAVVGSDAAIHCIFVDRNLNDGLLEAEKPTVDLLRQIRRRNEEVPIFLMAERLPKHPVTLEEMQLADEFVWKLEDTADFIAG